MEPGLAAHDAMSMTTAWLLLAMLALHAGFTWARIAVFRIDGSTPRGVRLIEVAAASSIAVGLGLVATRGDSSGWRGLAATLLAGASAGLFAWGLHTIPRLQFTAAFSNDPPTTLVTRGPYRYIRHPFYAAYVMAHALPIVATGSLWAWPGLLGMAAIYARAAHLEERKFLASPMAAAWREHQRRTGWFLPRWRTPAPKEAAQ